MTATATQPAPERDLAIDMAKRALPLAPVIIVAALLIRGANGAWSASLAIAIVVVNLLVAAAAMVWAARKSPNWLMGVALGGFLVRMLVLTGVVFLVKSQPWADLKTLAVVLLGTQLALLAWESKYVSATLAFPALLPSQSKGA